MTGVMLSIALLAGQAPAPAALPAWLAGCWVEERGESWTEECWTTPRGGVMLGNARSGRGKQTVMWEAMQILPDDANPLTFWASPRGSVRSAFPMVSTSEREIVFANAAHDYPQRIRYWREGATLNAEISMIDGSRPQRWRYRRTR